MCGIVGFIDWSQKTPEAYLKNMSDKLIHRGPDAGHHVKVGAAYLGHRRLSIIDPTSAADQPMGDITGRYWIVFNGEIYNFKELRAQFIKEGVSFKTLGDTEVILEAFKKWGEECVKHLRGMFAFAIWDSQKECLFLARDRLGEKPLYYFSLKDQGILFASELKALMEHPEVKREINFEALNQFLSLNYILTNSSIIKGVQKLPPAHTLWVYKERPLVLKRYWDLAHFYLYKPKWRSEEEAAQALNALLFQSVKRQLISDVPLGAFLSGGIDSSAIVSSMVRNTKAANIKTFSIGFHEKTYSELEQARFAARALGVEHFEDLISFDIKEALPKIVYAADEPFADSSIIPTYYLAQFARGEVKVCLSGDGGDELFAGYETYVADKFASYLAWLPPLKGMEKLISSLLPVTFNKVSFDYKVRQFLKGRSLGLRKAHYYWRSIFNEEDKQALIRPEWRRQILQKDPYTSFDAYFEEVKGAHFLDQAMYVDIKTWLVDDILVKVDRSTMAHSLEARAPFLDPHVVEFAAGLPVDWKLKGFEKKHILKESQKGMLPEEILQRKKKGFNAPISHWLIKDLEEMGKEVTLRGPLSEWFEDKEIKNLWQNHKEKRQDNGLKLFGLTCLGLWLKEFGF